MAFAPAAAQAVHQTRLGRRMHPKSKHYQAGFKNMWAVTE